MKTALIAISAFISLVIIAGCINQGTTSLSTSAQNCGSDINCLKSAEGNCSAAFGTFIDSNVTMYEEIRGQTAAGCTFYFNFEQPALGNATCIVPMNLMNQQSQQLLCQYCTGPFIDLLRSRNGC